eukprot:gnl/Spiro4/11131_TR5906_c0_g1_i1.p1 gnl/Spiro4/11131_TR5906_c0_g1~~gnl/Spiro4/11131_TR5906_c0_g1_i1.p1  ORF type:complete len:228 (-),score=30.90 gnl/Spiro4/11131_TR5906_c0_g1_i1:10-693(-)
MFICMFPLCCSSPFPLSVLSRIGMTRVTFAPYTHEQLIAILQERLSRTCINFNRQAIEYASRRIASVSGDIRCVFEACRYAALLAATRTPSDGTVEVQIDSVDAALSEMLATPAVLAVQNCALYEKIFLLALLLVTQPPNRNEATLDTVVTRVYRIFSQVGIAEPTDGAGNWFALCHRLVAHNLVQIVSSSSKCVNRFTMLKLHVMDTDVKIALRDTPVVKKLGFEW